MRYKNSMPVWLQVVIAIILIAAVACLAIYCIALAKDMTFVQFIESWFPKAAESVDSSQTAAFLQKIMR